VPSACTASAKDAIGRKAPELLGETGEPNASKAEVETVTNGEWTGELKHTAVNGHELVVESRWTLVRDENGAPKNILVVNTDITDKKRVAEQFLRTQRLESIGALASGIAHDLNNVFAPILMATELLSDSKDPGNARILDMVNTTAKRGADMVKQVLMFVRGSGNELEPMGLEHLANEVRRLMQETLPCTIEVTSDIPKNSAPILGDPTQLHQVLVNLCVNARDAMPDGGELRISLDEVTLDAATAREKGAPKAGRYARLTVADTGSGIPPDIQKKIFDPFFTTKEVGKGTGLGLSTVVSIVKTHNGFVELDSAVGKGSRFVINIPVCDFCAAEVEKAPERPAPGQGELILVVDDEQSVREITKLTLEVHNYRVLVANDGAEALSAYVQHRGEIALVITDIMMPVMNGRALIQALRKFDAYLPVVVFTAADKSNSLVGTLDKDTIPLLLKPVTPEQLLTKVGKCLYPPASPLTAPNPNSVGTHFSI
jgi:two-component system, cell cycle sensor histidine kinase and response regulator CckA